MRVWIKYLDNETAERCSSGSVECGGQPYVGQLFISLVELLLTVPGKYYIVVILKKPIRAEATSG